MRCCVSGCDSKKGNSSCSFYTFPSTTSEMKIIQARRELWIAAVFGDSSQAISKSTIICGRHFVTGKPAKLTETTADNWIPTLHLGEGRVAPKVNIVCGLPSIERDVPAPEQVIFKQQNVFRMVKSNEADPFQEDSTLGTVKEEFPDESPVKPELLIVEEEPVSRIEKSIEDDPFQEYSVEVIKAEVPDVEEAKEELDVQYIEDEDEEIQSIQRIQTDEAILKYAIRCMFCLSRLPLKEQNLPDFNKESTFRTQVEYVLAKKVDASSYPCCKNCKTMFHLFYKFKKSCLIALAKPQVLIKSTAQKRPAKHLIGPVPKRKPDAVTIHLKIDEPSKAESVFKGEDEPERPSSPDGYQEERLRCKNCGTMYDNGIKLEDHKRTCLPPKEKPRCHLCPSVFRNNWELEVHLNRHNGVTPFTCRNEGCSKAFYAPVARIVHEKKCQKKSDKVVCAICGMTFKCDSYLQCHMIIHDAPKYECEVCRRKFCDVTTFRAHMMRHFERNETAVVPDVSNAQFDFKCDSCEQAFITPEILNGHKVYCGKNEKFRKFRLLCPLCPESFNKQETLDQHLNRHKGIKSIPCRKEGCTKMFLDTAGRNVHELYRCGRGGTHICSICQVALGTPAALRIHMQSHRKATAIMD